MKAYKNSDWHIGNWEGLFIPFHNKKVKNVITFQPTPKGKKILDQYKSWLVTEQCEKCRGIGNVRDMDTLCYACIESEE